MPRAHSIAHSAPKGRNIPAQGNALGNRPPIHSSPEGAIQGWQIVHLEDVAESIQYGHTASSTQEAVGPRFLRITDIQDRRVDWETVPYCSIPKNQISKYRLAKGDLLFARTGATVGKSFLITTEIPESIFASYLIRVRMTDAVDPQFIAYYFQSADYWQQISDSSAGIGQPNVNGSKLAKITFPLPPLPEQRRIVARIEELFSRLAAGVSALRHAKAQLQRYRQSVLAAAVTGQLTQAWREQHPDTEPAAELLKRILKQRREQWNGKGKYNEPHDIDGEIPFKAPGSWSWTSSEAVCASVRDGTHDTPKYVDEGVPLITSKNLLSSGLSFENTKNISHADHAEISKRSGVSDGDILFAMIGTIGNPIVVRTSTQFSIKNVALFKSNESFVSSEYLRIWLSSPIFMSWLEPKQKGTTQKFVPLGLLRSLATPLPPLSEQHQIVAEVEARTTAIDHLEAELVTKMQYATKLRQSILRSAFIGDI